VTFMVFSSEFLRLRPQLVSFRLDIVYESK
jgi:hypothetical protein